MDSRQCTRGASILLLTLVLTVGHLLAQSILVAAQPTPPPVEPHPTTLFLPFIAGLPPARVLVAAAYVDSVLTGDPDEAILLWNAGDRPQPLAGWAIGNGTQWATFPLTATVVLEPGQRLWCTAQADAFLHSFGARPGCEWESDIDSATLNLDRTVSFASQSGRVLLRNEAGDIVDALAYGKAPPETAGWHGAPATLYTRGLAAATGQLYHRKLDPFTDRPVDTDTAADWAGDLADPAWGRRVRQPGWQGWDVDSLLRPIQVQQHAHVTLAVGPEGLFEPIATALRAAHHSIDLNIYTLEHPGLAAELAAALRRGVRVRILLEGGPPGGITPLQKWCVAQIAAAGGDVRYFAVQPTAPTGYRKRYRFAHAKFAIIDGSLGLVGTENFNLDAMPVPGAVPVGGRRGFYLFTDAPGVVAQLARLFALDWTPDVFRDLRPFALDDPKLGGPPADFVLPPPPEYPVAEAPFAAPAAEEGNIRAIVVSAPENALRPDAGINQLIAKAGAWGRNPIAGVVRESPLGRGDQQPRRRSQSPARGAVGGSAPGAQVRLLLDSFFDEEDGLRSNRATAEYVRAVAAAEGLNLDVRLGNPTLGGIHAKVVLLGVGGGRWTAVGSLNGGEVSTKLNREVVLLVDAPLVFDRAKAVFEHDWALSQ